MFGLFNKKVQDPVCAMKVDKQTKYISEFAGIKHYFCSEDCKKKFDSEPKKYADEQNAVSGHNHGNKSCC